MIAFAHPWLALVALGLAAAAAAMPRRRRPTFAFPASDRFPPSPRATRRARAARAFSGIAVVALIAALAGPRVRLRGETTPDEGIALALVVDVSASMATVDYPWAGEPVRRLDAVKRAFALLVAGGEGPDGTRFVGRTRDAVALVAFSARPELACPLTSDRDAALKILANQEPRTLVGDATTNPGDALALALSALRSAPGGRRAIVLFTDGEANVPAPALTPLQAGQLAANLGVPIYAIDALSDAETAGDAARAHETLVDLARLTGGRHFRAGDGAALAEAIRELDRLERDRLADPAVPPERDGARWLGLLALVAGALSLACGRGLP